MVVVVVVVVRGWAPMGTVDDSDDSEWLPVWLKGVEELVVDRGGGEEVGGVEVEQQLRLRMAGWVE